MINKKKSQTELVKENQNLRSTSFAKPVHSEEMRKIILDKFNKAITDNADGSTVRAAWFYDRKGYDSETDVNDGINASYSSTSDDILIQITVRVAGWDEGFGEKVQAQYQKESLETLKQERLQTEKALEEQRIEAEKKLTDLENKIAQAEKRAS